MKHLVLVIALFAPSVVAQNIAPSQVLIVGNIRNPDSLRLANLYAAQRHIPAKNILMLNLPDREDVTRSLYNAEIAYPIRQFLHQTKQEDKIKVLVTVYGLPLRVGAAEPTIAQRAAAQRARERFLSTVSEFEAACRDLEKMAGITTTQPTLFPGRANIEKLRPLLIESMDKLQKLYRLIFPRLQRIPDRFEQESAVNEFMRLRVVVEGQMALALLARDSAENKREILKRVGDLEKEYLTLLAIAPEKRDLDKTCQTARNLGGLYLELKTLHEHYGQLMQKDSLSAVDSELCLVLWDDYPLAGRVLNGLNPRFADNPMVKGKGPTLMVSRLDGPNRSVVERIIRDSLATEKKGLTGTFYLDARGMKNKDEGYFQYDQDLRNLSAKLEVRTKLPVILDDRPELFPPHSCPNTALYCGWYSLERYIPAFTFVPGAVGYHIASFEARTLKRRQNTGWVKGLLEDGICATLGPVEEPYLDSFPLPEEFFGLLLTGKYTLAEVYFKTIRYNSWRMILIGDPLYRPFAKNPPLKEKDIELKPLSSLLLE